MTALRAHSSDLFFICSRNVQGWKSQTPPSPFQAWMSIISCLQRDAVTMPHRSEDSEDVKFVDGVSLYPYPPRSMSFDSNLLLFREFRSTFADNLFQSPSPLISIVSNPTLHSINKVRHVQDSVAGSFTASDESKWCTALQVFSTKIGFIKFGYSFSIERAAKPHSTRCSFASYWGVGVRKETRTIVRGCRQPKDFALNFIHATSLFNTNEQ